MGIAVWFFLHTTRVMKSTWCL